MSMLKEIVSFWPDLIRSWVGGPISAKELALVKQQNTDMKAELAQFADGCIEAIKTLEEQYLNGNKINNEILNQQNRTIHGLAKKIANLVDIGVDVHFKSPHQIMIWSSLNGGQFKLIEVDIDNVQDLKNMVHELKERYGIDRETKWDAHPNMRDVLK